MTTYKSAGVDKEAGYETVQKIKEAVGRTHNENVLNHLGSFGALYALKDYKEPVLVSGTDGVGTKLMIAIETGRFATIGQDCYAMCANDVLCHGAKPLFFLDYLACGKLDPAIAAEIVTGISRACEETQCALVGGETAEMPGMYKVGDYDIAGFVVGVVERSKIIDGSSVKNGDVIIGLPSSGFHSNGFSLVRKVFPDFYEVVDGREMHEHLLEPTRLYQNWVLPLLEKFDVHGMAHITGGGLIENVPRVIPDGLSAHIEKTKIEVPALMQLLQERGKIEENEMWGTFNMGVGYTLIVPSDQAELILAEYEKQSIPAFVMGDVREGETKINLV